MTTLDRTQPSSHSHSSLSFETRWPRFHRALSSALAHCATVLPAAISPILNEPVDRDRDRSRRRYDLDDTQVGAPDPGSFRASGQGINFPAVFFFWTVAQLIGGVWWAATMQANVNALTAENQKLWAAITERRAKDDAQDLLISNTNNGLDERIRAKSREVLTDWGYIHIPRKGE